MKEKITSQKATVILSRSFFFIFVMCIALTDSIGQTRSVKPTSISSDEQRKQVYASGQGTLSPAFSDAVKNEPAFSPAPNKKGTAKKPAAALKRKEAEVAPADVPAKPKKS